MQGDRVYSYAFPLVDGHAVRICAALTAIDDHPKWRYQLVMTLESPVVAAGAGEGADEQQQWKVPAGRWTVTPKFYRINCLSMHLLKQNTIFVVDNNITNKIAHF
jgi:hypothetical protein